MEDRDILRGRIRDLAARTRNGDYPTRTPFLSLEEQSQALQLLKSPEMAGTRCLLAGGYPEADRQVMVFLPSWMEEEDFAPDSVITCLRVRPRSARFTDHPGHRDFLGALMHLGITREVVGDIVTDEEGAYILVLAEMAETIAGDLTRVRHTAVTAEAVPLSDCSGAQRRESVAGSIASERIDALIGMVFRLSRSSARERVEEEMVYAGGRLVTSASYTPHPGERISVRGLGKFIYLGTEGNTKKGRLIARAERLV